MPGHSLKIFVVTWNMGNAEQVGLKNVLDEKQAIGEYDLIVLGLQESTYSLKGQQVVDPLVHLAKQIQDMVGSGYVLIDRCQRAQLQLFVLAKTQLRQRITNIEKQVENTGILHVFPNKGGLLLTLNVDGTKLAFVSCHLTAHEGVRHCEERNASIVEILGGVRAGDKRIDITEQFHHIFWMGDMNYRTTFDPTAPISTKKNIAHLHNDQALTASDDVGLKFGEDDGDESEEEDAEEGDKKAERQGNLKKVLDLIARGQYEEVLRLDELNREIAANRVLNDFTALQPNFPPTFKRARNLVFDGSSASTDSDVAAPLGTPNGKGKDKKLDHPLLQFYNHKRLPSFTDRILYKSMPAFKSDVRVLFFESCEAAVSSDHKPVRAGFEVDLHRGAAEILVEKVLAHPKRGVEVKTLKLVVSDLRGYDLEEMDSQLFGGGSDPYIVFTTDPAPLLMTRGRLNPSANPESFGVKSSVVKHDINPVWPDVIELEVASVDMEGLSGCASLILAVWDEDRMNAHDLIGVMSIPFRDMLASFARNHGVFEFNQVLRYSSEVMGRISGKISLKGDFHEVVEVNQASINPDRHHLHHFAPLSIVVEESHSTVGCNCALN